MPSTESLATVTAPVIEVLLAHDFPNLPVAYRKVAADFTVRRLDDLPQHLYWGVGLIAALFSFTAAVAGPSMIPRMAGWNLPFVSEFPRLIRSLSYSFIWETWPDTSTSGTGASDSMVQSR